MPRSRVMNRKAETSEKTAASRLGRSRSSAIESGRQCDRHPRQNVGQQPERQRLEEAAPGAGADAACEPAQTDHVLGLDQRQKVGADEQHDRRGDEPRGQRSRAPPGSRRRRSTRNSANSVQSQGRLRNCSSARISRQTPTTAQIAKITADASSKPSLRYGDIERPARDAGVRNCRRSTIGAATAARPKKWNSAPVARRVGALWRR